MKTLLREIFEEAKAEVLNTTTWFSNSGKVHFIPMVDVVKNIEIDFAPSVNSNTLAYIKFVGNEVQKKVYVCTESKIQIATKEEIFNIILHEIMHIITCSFYNEKIAHDKRFRWITQIYGYSKVIYSATIKLQNDDTKAPDYRYHIKCKKCGGTLKKYTRMTKTIATLSNYTSSCCGADLDLVEIW